MDERAPSENQAAESETIRPWGPTTTDAGEPDLGISLGADGPIQ